MTLSGILPVLPTPFTAEGGVDPAALARFTRFALEAGVGGVVFPGFASEVETLTPDERQRLLALVVETVGGRVPVVAGATADRAADVVAIGRQAMALGPSTLMVQPPKSVGAGAPAVAAFMAEVAEGLPGAALILQNAPAPRGSDLSPAAIVEVLRAVPQVVWVKEETLPAGPPITAILAAGVPTLRGVIGGGGARYIIDEYARGACAAMPALELAPEHVAIDRAWAAGDRALARRLYRDTLPLLVLQALYRMRLTKHVLMRRGVAVNALVRAPTPELDAMALADIDACLAELGIGR
jgi:4-hydroxy-tetrahydrodipicolinate synthase